MGGEVEELCWADAADRRDGVSGRAAPGAGRGQERARRHVQAGVSARHHAAVAAPEGRAPVGVQRRPPGQRLQPLVPRRRARHLEPDFVRFSDCIGKGKRGRVVCVTPLFVKHRFLLQCSKQLLCGGDSLGAQNKRDQSKRE